MSQHLKAHLEHIISESNPWTALRMNRFFSTGTLLYTIVAAGIDISPPQVVPQDASRAINPAFAGFAFEEVSFHYFSGDKTNPNRVSQNLVKAITDKTQSRPNIRVGGSSLDLSTYHPEQKAPIIIPGGGGGPDGIPKNIEIGPSYMESFANFDAQYVVDIPLAKENLNNSLLFIDHAYEAVGAENLYALEIGNEPNNYPGNVRPDDWSREEYVTQWRDWTARISGELGFEENSKVWQAIGLAPGTGKPGFPPKAPGDWTV
ncbi:hypothetical protein FQN50_005697 [Emmonsiellopsis sp. PD_5]|nr:hypothetical protein FQN50_005697 [Emmonsiellopsis sp. PD_5]